MLVSGLVVAVASAGYIGKCAYDTLEWMRFKRDGVGRGLACVSGKVSGTNDHVKEIVEESNGDLVNRVDPNVLMNRILIKRYYDEQRTYTTYVTVGKTMVPITNYYIEEVSKTEFDTSDCVESMVLKNLTLKLNDKTKIKMPREDKQLKVYAGPAHSLLRGLGVNDNKKAKHYKIFQCSIRNGDHIVAVGIRHGSSMNVSHIGEPNHVFRSVRKNVFGVRYPRLFLASCLLVGSSTLAYDMYKHPQNY